MPEILCSVAQCTRHALARGLCSGHYGRWRKNGDPGPAEFRTRGPLGSGTARPSLGICAVEVCVEPARTRGWCKAHYQRWLDHGDPGNTPIMKKRQDVACAVADCHDPHQAGGLCQRHYRRARHSARPLEAEFIIHPVPRELLTYNALHIRIRDQRGAAADLACITCGGPAQHWAYQHNDPDEMQDAETGLVFSEDVEGCYEPMCVPCHIRWDRQHMRTSA